MPPFWPNGIFSTPLTSVISWSPNVACSFRPHSPVGLVRVTLITPPIVFRPNSVPCGPRSTSTDSTSNMSKTAPELLAMNTPSTATPTVGSATSRYRRNRFRGCWRSVTRIQYRFGATQRWAPSCRCLLCVE